MRIVNCGYCRIKVAELESGTRLKPYTLMLCQACAKKVGAMVAEHTALASKPKNPFDDFASIFGGKP